MTTISPRAVKILAFVLTILSGAIALVTSGAITLDVQVQEPAVESVEVESVEVPVEPVEVPAETPAEAPAVVEIQVVDEAADAPSADVAVEASGG